MAIRPITVPLLLVVLTCLGHTENLYAMDASTKEAVRILANDGATEFEAGRYASALDKFRRAYEAAPVPTLSLWLGRCHDRLGQLVAALESFRQAETLAPNELWVGETQQLAQSEAQQEIERLVPRIPKLVVRIEPKDAPSVSLEVDSSSVPRALFNVERPVDPGKRVVLAHKGNLTVRNELELGEGETKEVWVRFEGPVPVRAPSSTSTASGKNAPKSASAKGTPLRTWGWVSLTVGAGATVLGASTGLIALSEYQSLNRDCVNKRCEPAQWSEVDRYNTLRTVSLVGFVGGAIGLGAGVTLLLAGPNDPSRTALSFCPALGGGALSGTF